MKIRFDKHSLRFLTAIAVTFLLGIVLWYSPYSWIGMYFIITSLILVVMFFYASFQPRDHITCDERSTRVTEKAGYHAFWVLLMSMLILTVIDRHTDLFYDKMLLRDVSTELFLVGIYSLLILKWYYNKKDL
ncbi:putative membrane protein [Methanohalophilus levihalophilus]|uniref:DUF2178 domain-containing protein n=1 Tax=Methanohalophilus levihalophilus TaxID=1431282 RepID=UPI001AEADF8F|nr:DUF2178 domain-containing protein [Methanohalophilus levihalophilus]MBP2029901.1 putative membrane protein [Methanohalophilus levihalophilus]